MFMYYVLCPGMARPAADDEWQLYRIELQLPKRVLEVRVMVEDLRSSPVWNGAEPEEPPVPMSRAIEVARQFLVNQGCVLANYFLTKCTLIRVYRVDSLRNWYWEIEFAEKVAPASVLPTVTIPVLMTGKVPNATLLRGESKQKESKR